MAKIVDLVGKKFNLLTVLKYSHGNEKHQSYWDCVCDCGNNTKVRGSNLKGNSTKSCGCLQKEKITKHGNCNTPSYYAWVGMLQRCTNKKSRAYGNYGGRGITVCDKWINFKGFYEDMGEKPEGLSLDRKNNNGNYCKDNCKWSTPKEQANNRRSNINITYKGKTQNITKWEKECGFKRGILHQRIMVYKWDIEKSFNYKKYGGS